MLLQSNLKTRLLTDKRNNLIREHEKEMRYFRKTGEMAYLDAALITRSLIQRLNTLANENGFVLRNGCYWEVTIK